MVKLSSLSSDSFLFQSPTHSTCSLPPNQKWRKWKSNRKDKLIVKCCFKYLQFHCNFNHHSSFFQWSVKNQAVEFTYMEIAKSPAEITSPHWRVRYVKHMPLQSDCSRISYETLLGERGLINWHPNSTQGAPHQTQVYKNIYSSNKSTGELTVSLLQREI